MRHRFAQRIAAGALAFAPAFACAADLAFVDGFEDVSSALLIVHYPAGAHTITARGSGGGLSAAQGTTFARDGDTFTLALATSMPVQWKPLLDDATYALGPDYAVAPGHAIEIWPRFTQATGQVITLIAAFPSTLLGNTRPIYAYLPPTYVENTDATMPVVYLQDGQNLFAAHPEWAFFGQTWQVDTAFDAGAADGSIAEAIVIGVANTPNRIYEYTPTEDPGYPGSGGADLYLRMLVEELKPQIDASLRTRAGRESTVIGGSSLGGLLAAYAGRTKPLVFGKVAALSPSSWWDNQVIVADVASTPAAPSRPLKVYVDSADSTNDAVTETNALAAAYLNVGYADGVDFLHVVQPGAQHNEVYWAQRFPGAMQFVLGPRD